MLTILIFVRKTLKIINEFKTIHYLSNIVVRNNFDNTPVYCCSSKHYLLKQVKYLAPAGLVPS